MTLRWSPRQSVALATLMVVALSAGACSSSKAPQRSEFGPTYKERMGATDKAMKNSNSSMRSSFEKEIAKSTTGKAYKTPAYNARDAAGVKKFSGTDSTYHAGNFSGSGTKSPVAQKVASEAAENNKLASRMFRTPDSQFESKSSRDGERTFTQGDGTFATRENRAATDALEKNKKPVILDPEKPTYSEDDVKRLLNKG